MSTNICMLWVCWHSISASHNNNNMQQLSIPHDPAFTIDYSKQAATERSVKTTHACKTATADYNCVRQHIYNRSTFCTHIYTHQLVHFDSHAYTAWYDPVNYKTQSVGEFASNHTALKLVAIRISSDVHFMFLCLHVCTIPHNGNWPCVWLPGNVVAHGLLLPAVHSTRPIWDWQHITTVQCSATRTSQLFCHHKKCSSQPRWQEKYPVTCR